MQNNIKTNLADFKRCAEDAPAGAYEHVKRLDEVMGDVCDALMSKLKDLGLKANACDHIYAVEAAIYDYVKKSNPDNPMFPTAEGFGAAMNTPARDRVIGQAAQNAAFLRKALHQVGRIEKNALGEAVVAAVLAHQQAGKGLRPAARWTDADTIDSGLLFEALTQSGLDPSDENEVKLDRAVSAIVFGAYHQDGSHPSIINARAQLNLAGYHLAEMRWNCVSNHTSCPLTGEDIIPSFGYWPFVGRTPVSVDAFEPEVQKMMRSVMDSYVWQTMENPPDIVGYFVTKKNLNDLLASSVPVVPVARSARPRP